MANWEKKSSYLLREIVKFRTYIDSLQAAETQKNKIYAEMLRRLSERVMTKKETVLYDLNDLVGLRARRRRNTFEYYYDEYAYALCFMLLSCTGRHIRSECAHTGTIWLALGSARLFEISFSCFDSFFKGFFKGEGWHSYWKSGSA